MNLKNKRNQMWILALMLGALLLLGVLMSCQPDGDVIPKAVERESVLCATEAGNCVESWNGSDIVMYSGAQSGQTLAIDGATGNVDSEGTGDFAGAITSRAEMTITDYLIIDNDADQVALTVQGYDTPTTNLIEFQTSAGANLFFVDHNGDAELNGTTPSLVIGDAGTEDTGIVFDGNAEDFTIALDDTADDLVIGLGLLATVGTTPTVAFDADQDAAFSDDVSVSGNLDAGGTFNYGSGDLTPLSHDSTTQYEVYFGSADSVTQTTVTSATHNCTTAVDWGMCFVSDPDADAGDPAYCTISISGSSITFQALDDDGDNAANAATKIYYLIIGR
jgi:hypothetical protein